MAEDQARARPLSNSEVNDLLWACGDTRYTARNRVILLLAVDGGLTVTEISALKRSHVMEDGLLARNITVPGRRSRVVPMSERLWLAILEMMRGLPGFLETPLVLPERNPDGMQPMRPGSVEYVIYKLRDKIGLSDASARSGKRTFVEKAIRSMPLVGASIADVCLISGYPGPRSLTGGGPKKLPSRLKSHPERRKALVNAMAQCP